RAHLAWLLADGSLHPWAPTANADVHQIVIVDTIAFLIGDFTQINGLPRNSIAAVHAITGDLLPWDPHPDWAVHSMIIYNDQAILAGYFHSIGDSLRESIAFLDLATLTITGLDLGLSVASQITSMDLEGDKLYMAGPIDVLGVSRPQLACVDLSDTSVVAWPSGPYTFDANMKDLVVAGNKVIVSGSFTEVNGQPRKYLCAINRTTGTLSTWNPSPNYSIFTIAYNNGAVLVGGEFSNIGNAPHTFLAAVDTITGAALAWDPVANGDVYRIVPNGSTVFVGGEFTSIGGQYRRGLIAIDLTTRTVLPWDPQLNGPTGAGVYDILIRGNKVYVAGDFTTAGGVAKTNMACFDRTTGAVVPTWHANVIGGYPHVLAAAGARVIIGGQFSSVRGQPRDNIASTDTITGALATWTAGATGGSGIYHLRVIGTKMYVGGEFTHFGGLPRAGLAVMSPFSGVISAFDPMSIGQYVTGLGSNGNTFYVAGPFNTIAGSPRQQFAAFDATTDALLPYAPWTHHITDIVPSNGRLYLGGAGSEVYSQQTNGLAAVDLSDWSPLPWTPRPDGTVTSLAIANNTLYVGGAFANILGQPRSRIAAIDPATLQLSAWAPEANNTVRRIAASSDHLVVSGDFTTIGGAARTRLADLSQVTGLATAWAPNPNNSVGDITLVYDTLYTAGNFTLFGGATRTRFAATDLATNSLLSWAPTSNGAINGICAQGNLVSAVGAFTQVNGQACTNHVLLYRNSGTTAVAFTSPVTPANANIWCTTILPDTGLVLVGGSFIKLAPSIYRDRIASYTTAGSVTSWAPVLDGAVRSMVVHQKRIFVAGGFDALLPSPGTRVKHHGIMVFDYSGVSTLGVQAFLQGPLEPPPPAFGARTTPLMRDALRTNGLLPLTEPYTAMGRPPISGPYTIDPSVLTVAGNDAIVDWVLLELRSNMDANVLRARRAALIQRDGDVVDLDGTSPVSFSVDPGSYYVALRHRNHLPAMSLVPLSVGGGQAVLNMTDGSAPFYGLEAISNTSGVRGLWAGDVRPTGVIKYAGSFNDRDLILIRIGGTVPTSTVAGYLLEDANLDGLVKYAGAKNDRDVILQNIGGATPTVVRNEQMP
ncbi:MAG: PQQ-binding-like beta-propeller repeat protein, partial [Flavobacteriales bacterium]|nr:PQQ-binding-like beta-propeller repeat protein [Flavobacteriales bacterium]